MVNFLWSVLSVWRPLIEISIISILFYYLYMFIRDTRALNVAKGLFFLVIMFFVTQKLKLHAISWILTHIFPISIIAFVIIFHPEIRRGLAQLGRRPFFSLFEREEDYKEEHLSEVIVEAVTNLSEKKIGALVAIERNIGLKNYCSTGVMINSAISKELLFTIFMPHTPLHDGGVIISDDKILAAAALFPLSQRPFITQIMGTRHRAAVGLTEETDALVIVISEETGIISLAGAGKLDKDINPEKLKRIIKNVYISKKQKPLNIKILKTNNQDSKDE